MVKGVFVSLVLLGLIALAAAWTLEIPDATTPGRVDSFKFTHDKAIDMATQAVYSFPIVSCPKYFVVTPDLAAPAALSNWCTNPDGLRVAFAQFAPRGGSCG
jgi:hypothetical protein